MGIRTLINDALGDSSMMLLEAYSKSGLDIERIYLIDSNPIFRDIFPNIQKNYTFPIYLEDNAEGCCDDINFIVPSSQLRDLKILKNKRLISKTIFPPIHFLELLSCKFKTSKFLGKYSLATALNFSEMFCSRICENLLLKPRYVSGGGKSIQKISISSNLEFDSENYYLEEFTEKDRDEYGEFEYLLDLCAYSGSYSYCIRKIYRMKGGGDVLYKFINQEDFKDIKNKVIEFVDWFTCKTEYGKISGIFNIQFFIFDKRIKVFDLNVRSSGGLEAALDWFNPISNIVSLQSGRLVTEFVPSPNDKFIFRRLKVV